MIGNKKDAATAVRLTEWVRSFAETYPWSDEYPDDPFDREYIGTTWYCDDEEDEEGYVVASLSAEDGWVHLGSGCYRSVWLSPSGIAYKVQVATWSDSNMQEIMTYTDSPRVSTCGRVRLPRMRGIDVPGTTCPVLAVEYIDPPAVCYSIPSDIERICARMWGVNDVHLFNVFPDPADPDKWVCIDFAQ